MTLYELTNEFATLLGDYYAAEDDIEAAAVLEKLTAVGTDITAKADGYAKIIRNTLGEIDALKAEEKRLKRMRETREKLVDRLKANMFEAMTVTGATKIDTTAGKWYTQKNTWSAEITDEAAVPERFKTYKTEVVIDKKALIAEHKDTGEDFDGVVIEQKLGIRFR